VPTQKLVRFLFARGFCIVSQRGSPIKLRSEAGVTSIISNHPGHDVKVGLLHSILATADLDVEESLREV
jgi:predicted RNA binding protein YcfA (HicA-like mRNA interferase family)